MLKYSLIRPRYKRLVRLDTQLWIGFTTLIFGVFFLMQTGFAIMQAAVDYSTKNYEEERIEIEKQIQRVELNIEFIKSQKELGEKVGDRNKIVSESIVGLFDLVPDSIYLNEAVIEKDKLILRGYTPSKEIYNYLLLPPLKSIFTTTKTSFFPMDNGWFRFMSVNESEKESIYEKE
ncbi:MAG: hypothetical protein OIF32_03415 [Campylobacterales bacterium]|nr:hypothetical protein [Campylobacterales bacterium]